ncbi:MAG: glycosyltransferase family 4 protein [Bacteroidetes bacterium]|nr:glycosyltransferase family 4 protein [Bacteroidota bacterium]
MIRICTSLSNAGYRVTLVGYTLKDSQVVTTQPYHQKRINCLFKTGKSFYIEYNIRLFFYLLFKKTDLICAIDLDTILPCFFISKIKGIHRVYDAHELFCEMQEIVSRPFIYKVWKRIEKFTVPSFQQGYTVNRIIADEFKKLYNVDYEVIQNTPVLKELIIPEKNERYILYQGGVNEGRSFDTLIPAMKMVNAKLVIAGGGNYLEQTKKLVTDNELNEKVIFTGRLLPPDLYQYTLNAWIGLTLFEDTGLSNYYSLANRFFDYMHAGLPQLCMNYPVYAEINKTKPVAVLIDDLSPENIAAKLNQLLKNDVLYVDLRQNCMLQRKVYNWQAEEKKLINFYKQLFSQH